LAVTRLAAALQVGDERLIRRSMRQDSQYLLQAPDARDTVQDA